MMIGTGLADRRALDAAWELYSTLIDVFSEVMEGIASAFLDLSQNITEFVDAWFATQPRYFLGQPAPRYFLGS
jgi:hypothetical protein